MDTKKRREIFTVSFRAFFVEDFDGRKTRFFDRFDFHVIAHDGDEAVRKAREFAPDKVKAAMADRESFRGREFKLFLHGLEPVMSVDVE